MAYEVDFLPVGEGKKGGDAIAMRFGDFSHPSTQTVIVIDSGFGAETSQQLAALIRNCYRTNWVDLVVSTHPDADHIGGLETVLDEFEGNVGCLAMHMPWYHHDAIRWIGDNRATRQSVGSHLSSALTKAVSLEKKARQLGVKIVEPFTGMERLEMVGGKVEVVGPSREVYNFLLPHFDGMPEYAGTFRYPMVKFDEPPMFTPEKDEWELEYASLSNDSWTSAKNNSSVILQVTVDNRRLLFTGDAGILALTEAANYITMSGAAQIPLQMIQIPHHGSRNNVGPALLDNLVGRVVPISEWRPISAVASCAPDGHPRFPNDRVLNAFRRRGVGCYVTGGEGLRIHHMAPPRIGHTPVSPHEFKKTVEEPKD